MKKTIKKLIFIFMMLIVSGLVMNSLSKHKQKITDIDTETINQHDINEEEIEQQNKQKEKETTIEKHIQNNNKKEKDKQQNNQKEKRNKKFNHQQEKEKRNYESKRLSEIPKIQIVNKINKTELLNDFLDIVEQNKLLDKERFPYEINYNHLLLTNLYRIELEQNEIRDIFEYMNIVLNAQNYMTKPLPIDVRYIWRNQIQLYNQLKMNWKNENVKLPSYCNNRVDVIWTYVNGSEQHWMETYQIYSNTTIDDQRYREYGSLKYSMRSVYDNVPYDVHWHLIVQDEYQIPTFLNKKKLIYYNDKSTPGSLRIIYHKDYFPDPSALPVFNSNAIEAAMYNLEGIGECVMYLNDDFFVNTQIMPSLNFDENGKIKCYFYHGLVLNFTNSQMFDKANFNSNQLLNKYYNENLRRHVNSHSWTMFRTSVMKKGCKLFEESFLKCTKNKLRSENDIGFYTFILNYMVREGYGIQLFQHRNTMKYTLLTTSKNVMKKEYSIIKKKQHPFVCINDGLNGKKSDVDDSIDEFLIKMEELYPTKTPFEKS